MRRCSPSGMRLRPSGDSTRASELSNAGSLSVTGWMADAFAGESPREHRHDLRAGRREEHDVDAVQVELAAEQVAAPCNPSSTRRFACRNSSSSRRFLTIARDGERVMLHPISDEAHLFRAYTGDRVVA